MKIDEIQEEVTRSIKIEKKGDTETNGCRLKTCIRRLKIVHSIRLRSTIYELKLTLFYQIFLTVVSKYKSKLFVSFDIDKKFCNKDEEIARFQNSITTFLNQYSMVLTQLKKFAEKSINTYYQPSFIVALLKNFRLVVSFSHFQERSKANITQVLL